MTVKVVTDSTSDLPSDMAAQMNIETVPLKVRFGDQEYRDGVDMSSDEFYRKLTASADLPTTSQPSIGDFVAVYERLGSDCDGIVSVHVSSKLSGTYNSALQASRQAKVDCPIEVVDTSSASLGLGMVAIKTAAKAAEGADVEAVAKAAVEASRLCNCIVMLDTLEYLEKGGRIGKARAMLGSLLRIKPLIIVRDGEVHEFGKERTRRKGLARLAQAARDIAPVDELAILYSTEREEAENLAANLQDLLPMGKKLFFAQFGPVLGTHVGPNAIGVGILRSSNPS